MTVIACIEYGLLAIIGFLLMLELTANRSSITEAEFRFALFLGAIRCWLTRHEWRSMRFGSSHSGYRCFRCGAWK